MRNLPEYAVTTIGRTKRLCVVKRGTIGYFEIDMDFETEAHARRFADNMNAAAGVTNAQREALTIGSTFGWDAPGADPSSPLCASATSLLEGLDTPPQPPTIRLEATLEVVVNRQDLSEEELRAALDGYELETDIDAERVPNAEATISIKLGPKRVIPHAIDAQSGAPHTPAELMAFSGVIPHAIDAQSVVIINADEPGESSTSFAAFIAANADAIADGLIDPAEIRATLEQGAVFLGGGGAAATWSIRLAPQRCPICNTPSAKNGCQKAYRCLCGRFISCDDYCGDPQCPGYKISPDQWPGTSQNNRAATEIPPPCKHCGNPTVERSGLFICVTPGCFSHGT